VNENQRNKLVEEEPKKKVEENGGVNERLAVNPQNL
jgi:hypothetical protein